MYLVYAYIYKDKEAAREALSVIRHNYAKEIVTDRLAFQEISKWAEEDYGLELAGPCIFESSIKRRRSGIGRHL